MARHARLASERFRSEALLLRQTALGEADLIVMLFTEQMGSVSAVARGARRANSSRLAGLEPMHLLRVEFELTPGRELAKLKEVSLLRPRMGLLANLKRLEFAGRTLRWLRLGLSPNSPEPALWVESNALLDALDACGPELVESICAGYGLRLLQQLGWALDLEKCVLCARPCPENASSMLDLAAGGIVCRHCGGRGIKLSSRERLAMRDALAGKAVALAEPLRVIEIVERALAIHARGETP